MYCLDVERAQTEHVNYSLHDQSTLMQWGTLLSSLKLLHSPDGSVDSDDLDSDNFISLVTLCMAAKIAFNSDCISLIRYIHLFCFTKRKL